MKTNYTRMKRKRVSIWEKQAETMSRDELEGLQAERLRATLKQVCRVRFYQKAFQDRGISPEDIRSVEDLVHFPFTVKDDLREDYPYGLFAVPLSNVVRIHSSSGTTGSPTVVGYTKRDLETWTGLIARVLTASGVTREDILQVSFGYGLFTGGFGLHYGAERIGATVIPVSSGKTARQVSIMKDLGTTVLVCTPSYALHLSEAMYEFGIDPETLALRLGLFGGEPWCEQMRTEIEDRLHISATDNYGLSEVMGPGVSMECECKAGMHINEDHFLAEIIDPNTGERLPPGTTGELVITTLTKEAVPLIRYRTGDITQVKTAPCACGRTFARMAKPVGRTDDMLIIRGVNVYPSQVEMALMEIEEAEPHYQLVLTREGAMDELEVRLEVKERFLRPVLERKIAHHLNTKLGLSTRVQLLAPKTIQRSEGKADRVVDLRQQAPISELWSRF